MPAFDDRIVQVGIEVDGRLKIYEGLYLTASGTKFANANQDECQVKIGNVDRATMDFILTETSEFNKNRTPKRLEVYAGRKSYGAALIFRGDITASTPSQPPDIILTIKAQTGSFSKGDIIARNQSGMSQLSTIARNVATDLGVSLNFEAQDKQIANYSFSGGALKQVNALGSAGNVSAFVDGEVLHVKDYGKPLAGRSRVLDVESGMVGQPELTERGVKVKYLLDNTTAIGGQLVIKSRINPAVDGTYSIYKLSFDIASREDPFYWIAEAERI